MDKIQELIVSRTGGNSSSTGADETDGDYSGSGGSHGDVVGSDAMAREGGNEYA